MALSFFFATIWRRLAPHQEGPGQVRQHRHGAAGGLSVIVFGDLYQLQPPKARYVFEEPTNKEHALAYQLRNLWQLFKVANLVENHRQGEDKVYGDLLNRLRIGAHTEEDVSLLETRIRPKSDPILNNALHVYGTNAKVNARNTSKLVEHFWIFQNIFGFLTIYVVL